MLARDTGTARARSGTWFGVALLCLALVACAPGPRDGHDPAARAALPQDIRLPAMKTFAPRHAVPPERANGDVLRDFLDLSFMMESGRPLPHFSRFEEPVTVRLAGAPSALLSTDLDRVIRRLRIEAGLDIRRVAEGDAHITIEVVSGARIRRHVPTAACFVVPNISRLSDYRRARRQGRTDWTRITTRKRAAIFVPMDSSPQESRDCLHEELAQALGPLNDLYSLVDSVFNDDNMHGVLTGFDMLVLRAYYAPELSTGMTRSQVAARLPAILARLNPQGARIAPRAPIPTPRDWIRAIQTALGRGTDAATRRDAARRALHIAETAGITDHRRGFSHFALGKLTQADDPEFAQRQFVAADAFYRRTPGADIQRAHVGVPLASRALDDGRADDALMRLAANVDVAQRHENAGLLATLLMLRADALDMKGQAEAAHRVRLDSLGWARYGFGLSVVVPAAKMRTGHREANRKGSR